MNDEEEIGRKGNDEKEKEGKVNDEKERKENDKKEKEGKENDEKEKEEKENDENEDYNCVTSSSEGVGSCEKFLKQGLSLQINISHTADEKKEIKRRSSFGPPKLLRRSQVVREDNAEDPELLQHVDLPCPGDRRSEQELNPGAGRSGYSGAGEKKKMKRISSYGPPKPLRKRSKSVCTDYALEQELYQHQELDDEPIQGASEVEREPLREVKKRSRSVQSKLEPKVVGKSSGGVKTRIRSVYPKIEPRAASVEEESVEEVKKRSRTVHTYTKVPVESRKRSKTVLGFDGSASLKRMCLGSDMVQYLDQGRRRSLRLAGIRPGLNLTAN